METVYIVQIFVPRCIKIVHNKAYSSLDKAEKYLINKGYVKPDDNIYNIWYSSTEQFVFAKIFEFEVE